MKRLGVIAGLLALGSSHANPDDLQLPLFAQAHVEAVCSTLNDQLPTRVAYPGDGRYQEAQASYWIAQQRETTPSCRVFPADAAEVQGVLHVLLSHKISFAVVAGGHSSNGAASNIEAPGVTIDLSALNEITPVVRENAVRIGPGARWAEIYTTLEPLGLGLAGARAGHVGAGGYVLGGGFSWFANRDGWSCDSALEFEIVTPDLRILNINPQSHADLFWAVKGSLGAFGIVTKIKLRTVRGGGTVYGGAISYGEHEVPQVFATLEHVAQYALSDVESQAYVSFAYGRAARHLSCVAYVLNVRNDSSGPTIRGFKSILHTTSTIRWMTIGDSAAEIDESNTPGLRRTKFTLTAYATARIMTVIQRQCRNAAAKMELDPKGILAVAYVPLTTPHLRKTSGIFARRLSHSLRPLLLVSVDVWWTDPAKDAHFNREARALHNQLRAELEGIDGLHPWIYPNYAAAWQNALGEPSLDSWTVRRMRAVRAQYDGDGA